MLQILASSPFYVLLRENWFRVAMDSAAGGRFSRCQPDFDPSAIGSCRVLA